MKLIITVVIFIFLTFFGCNNPDAVTNNQLKEVDIDNVSTNDLKTSKIDTNFTDKNGLKQGVWKYKKKVGKDTIIEIKTYRNDTLNGYFEDGTRYCRREGYYKEGKLDSLLFNIIDANSKNKNYLMLTYYVKGEKIWAAFGLDQEFIFPLKSFHLEKDTVNIRAPFYNKNLWYEGKFVVDKERKKNCPDHHIGVGLHKVFYPNGNIHAIINYDSLKVRIYQDSTGLKFNSYSFYEYNKMNVESALFKYVEDKYFTH